jgi:hypothetical protein
VSLVGGPSRWFGFDPKLLGIARPRVGDLRVDDRCPLRAHRRCHIFDSDRRGPCSFGLVDVVLFAIVIVFEVLVLPALALVIFVVRLLVPRMIVVRRRGEGN